MLRKRYPGRRAIMLISVLFLTVLTLMFVSAAVALAPSSLTRSQADVALGAARRATQSGIDWVRSRVSQDPQWRALSAATFSGPGLHVSEGDGQVTGWVQDSQGWGRFRIRFNYQDGPTSLASNSDQMNDPPNTWSDFPYLSCNNLIGATPKLVPIAASGSSYASPGPWSNVQLTVPANTLLLSVEGGYGNGIVFNAGVPVNYTGAVHRKNVQTMLKLGSNQPITNAAVMAAGNLAVSAYNSPVQLKAAAGEPARLRTKGSIGVTGSITSPNGELMAGGGVTVSGTKTGITEPGDDGTGFFKIPLSKVRAPVSPITLSAGVYVVTASGQVNYVAKNYADYADDNPRPTGTPISLPVGMTVVTNTGSPKYSIQVSKDLQINAAGTVTDFALIPDGGAPQSQSYGGVPAATATGAAGVTAIPTATASVNYWFGGVGVAPTLQSPVQLLAWQSFASTLTNLGPTTIGGAAGGTGYTRYAIPGGGSLTLPDSLPSTGLDYYPWISGTSLSAAKTNLANHLNHPSNNSHLSTLQLEIPLPGTSPSPSPSPSPGAPGSLAPKDLELKLQGGASGLTLANDGDIIIGAQIDGNGSAIVSRGPGGDISLIGTSTDLSSSAGTQLGLNLYATGDITIDAYRLDASGGSFGSVNLKGVIYAWHNIKVLVGDTGTTSSPFQMRGSLVAYGGDPATDPVVNTAQVEIRASDVDITYDPSYVASLVSSGPFKLNILSWHEF